MLWILIQKKKTSQAKTAVNNLFRNPAAVMSSTRAGAMSIHAGAIPPAVAADNICLN
jgi:hypothetical protein